MVTLVETVTERVAAAETWLSESVTVTPKVADPAVGVVPARTPFAETARPIAARLDTPEVVTDQLVYVPEPPVAVNA